MATKTDRQPGKNRSRETTEGVIRAPHRAMMRALGLSDDDIDAPFVGIASTHNEVTPCNAGIAPLVEEVKRGVFAARGTPFVFGTITVSDAISMGTEGMRGSLVSREVIADSIETVMFAERFDGLVAVAGCDKSLPGSMMAMARLNVPSIFVYAGSILPGRWRGEDIQIQTVFEAVRKLPDVSGIDGLLELALRGGRLPEEDVLPNAPLEEEIVLEHKP